MRTAKFDTGAVREATPGRGRFDLASPYVRRRIALVYERGADKYADRNWEKGMPYSRYMDSALRHITQWQMRMDDEDHLAQAIWNLCAIAHHEEAGPEGLDDRPVYGDKR